MKRTPVSAALTFYTEANELGIAGYKARNSSKVIQSPYSSVKKSELYTILIVLLNFNDSLNMIIDSQYRLILNTEGVVLHTETDGLIPDNSELMLLFMQL